MKKIILVYSLSCMIAIAGENYITATFCELDIASLPHGTNTRSAVDIEIDGELFYLDEGGTNEFSGLKVTENFLTYLFDENGDIFLGSIEMDTPQRSHGYYCAKGTVTPYSNIEVKSKTSNSLPFPRSYGDLKSGYSILWTRTQTKRVIFKSEDQTIALIKKECFVKIHGEWTDKCY